MALPSFTVTGNLRDILDEPSEGELNAPAWLDAYVIFVSNVQAGVVVWDGGIHNRPPSVRATVDEDGSIVIDGDPVKLLANDAGLNVEGLQWRCDIKLSAYNTVTSFWFDAPADGATVNLATVVPAPNTPVTGVPCLTETSFIALVNDPESDLREAIDNAAGGTPTSRTITAGTGLTGGGDLTANRSLAVDFGTGAGKVTQGNDSRLSDARTPSDASVSSVKVAKMAFYHDFTLDEAGSPPAVSQSGHTLTYSRTDGDSAAEIASGGGGLVNPDTTSGGSATYVTADLGADVKYYEIEFAIASVGTGGQRCASVLWESPMPSGVLSGSNRSPSHNLVGPTDFTAQTYDSTGPVVVNLGVAKFQASLGTAVQTLRVAVDKAHSRTVYMLPDGKVVRVGHADIGSWSAPYLCSEIFYTDADTDGRVSIKRIRGYADGAAADAELAGKWETLLLLGEMADTIVHPTMTYYTGSISATATGTPSPPDGNLLIYAKCPPSGIITVEVEMRINQTVAGTYGWMLYDMVNSVYFDAVVVAQSVHDGRVTAKLRTTSSLAPGATPDLGYLLQVHHISLSGTTAVIGSGNSPAVLRVLPTS